MAKPYLSSLLLTVFLPFVSGAATKDPAPLWRLKLGNSIPNSIPIGLTSDGQVLVVLAFPEPSGEYTLDLKVKRLNARTGAPLSEWSTPKGWGPTERLFMTKDDKLRMLLAQGSPFSPIASVYSLDCRTGQAHLHQFQAQGVNQSFFTEAGDRYLCTRRTRDGAELKRYSLATDVQVGPTIQLPGASGLVDSFRISPDGRLAAAEKHVFDANGELVGSEGKQLFDLLSGKVTRLPGGEIPAWLKNTHAGSGPKKPPFDLTRPESTGLDFNVPTGDLVFTITSDGFFEVWKAEDFKKTGVESDR